MSEKFRNATSPMWLLSDERRVAFNCGVEKSPSLLCGHRAMLQLSGGILRTKNVLEQVGFTHQRTTCQNLHAPFSKTLFSPEEIRAWLKPLAHTSDPKFSIGAPWEIRRVSLNSTSDGRIIDLYTKDGYLLSYYSKVVLVPDFGVTIAINVAGDGAGTVIKLLSELVVSEYVPVLETIARKQTFQQFGGFYVSSETNSSMRIEVDGGPGFAITSWVNSGVDALLETIPSMYDSPLFGPPRMYPTSLQNSSNKTLSTSYRVIFALESQNDGLQIFSDACSDWGLLDSLSYGKVGLDDVVFIV
ncbi:hypothetical protein BKA56DRAFT_622583 [Ilyonectria sp. MPI-CAGE-AT-0026]|nr:hypothetical protein BKA56DRAFT_622583 [Ilyonectria sp. MPI-CAGE-AT-0026]